MNHILKSFGMALLIAQFLYPLKTFATEEELKCIQDASAIELKLNCLSGMSVQEVPTGEGIPADIRQFELKFTQPVDHERMDSGRFVQRLVLLHRSEDEPMVLQTSGYEIFGVKPTAIATLFKTNQIQVEHRFFAASTPDSKDWSKLTIQQSAKDFHRIVVALKQIYGGRWINTGASKGGMTSVYHRRFFPEDVDGTVADVAPQSYGTRDLRYNAFLEKVGQEEFEKCRNLWRRFQIKLLENRETFLPKIAGNFNQLGNKEVAFEHSIVESHFLFWQYLSPTHPELGCDSIPLEKSTDELWKYLQEVNEIKSYTDEDIARFMPYYYQAATQLGSPAAEIEPFSHLLKYPFATEMYVPHGVPVTFDSTAMPDIQLWVKKEARKILFVYGEFDPWSAGAFEIGGRFVSPDLFRLWVPKGNHSSKFNLLGAEDKEGAVKLLSQWLSKAPEGPEVLSVEDASLEALEALVRRKHRLP